MKSMLSTVLFLGQFAMVIATEREVPTSGVVFRKVHGIRADHVTNSSGADGAIVDDYFVCIQRDPRKDEYASRWLKYRQCWDVNKATWDRVAVCDWFTLTNRQAGDTSTPKPSGKKFAKKRREDLKAIKRFHVCDAP